MNNQSSFPEDSSRSSPGIVFQTILLVLGLYFFCRVFRNNLYFPLIAPLEATRPALYEGLRYLGHLIMLGGVFLYFALVPEERFCLRPARFTKEGRNPLLLVSGLFTGFLMNAVSVSAALLHGDIDMVRQSFNPLMLVFLFVCVFVQSATEEFQFRLMAHERILAKTSLSSAIAGTAVAFVFAHMLNFGISFTGIINLALISVLCSLSLFYFGSVWFACGLHAAWNFTQNCIFGLPNSGFPAVSTVMAPTYTISSFFYDADFGVEGTWITAFIIAAAIVIFLLLIKKKKRICESPGTSAKK